MICDVFTQLHGRRTDDREKSRFIHYFICSSLFDDFTDYQLISERQLYDISFHPDNYMPRTFDEKVFLYAHRLLRNFVQDKENYDRISHELFQAQLDSKKQYNSQLDDQAIRSITFSKGGNSVLLCRYYLDIAPGDVEEKCWFQIGKLIQVTNDLFDIYKDLQDHITTLPNHISDVYTFEQFFVGQIKEMKALIAQLPYSLKTKRRFSLSMAGIYAFGLIAVAQLKKIQGNASRLPDLKTLPRKQLIVDMEKPGNLIRWFKFVYRYAKI